MTLGINIKGIDCSKNSVLFWNGKYAQIYEIQGSKNPVLTGQFETPATVMGIHEENVFQCSKGKIEVCNFQGEVKHVLPLTETDGDITHMDVRGRHMAIATSTSMIKVLDVSRRNFKQVGMTKRFERKKNGDLIGEIKAIFLNPDGKKLCILSDQTPIPSIKIPDTKFFIFDVETEAISEAEVGYNRVPIEAFWDQEDPRLLAIETEYIKDISRATMDEEPREEDESKAEGDTLAGGLFKEEKEEWTGKTVETFFVTRDYGTKKQDTLRFEDGEETVLGISVPYFFYLGQQVAEE